MYLDISERSGGIPNRRMLRDDQRHSHKTLKKGTGFAGVLKTGIALGIPRDRVDHLALQPSVKVQRSFGLHVSDWPALTKNLGPSM